jgi:hypothetical protein
MEASVLFGRKDIRTLSESKSCELANLRGPPRPGNCCPWKSITVGRNEATQPITLLCKNSRRSELNSLRRRRPSKTTRLPEQTSGVLAQAWHLSLLTWSSPIGAFPREQDGGPGDRVRPTVPSFAGLAKSSAHKSLATRGDGAVLHTVCGLDFDGAVDRLQGIDCKRTTFPF